MILKRIRAFTLMEMILSVSIFALLAGIVSPIYISTKNRDDLDTQVDTFVSAVRRTQILSMASQQDLAWSLRLEDDEIIIFAGNDFLNRDPNFDDNIDLHPSLVVDGFTELNFSKLNGSLDNDYLITLSLRGLERVININQRGIIDY